MAISISDLPPQYQQQALKQVLERDRVKSAHTSIPAAAPDKPAKYHNKKTTRVTQSGKAILFDSQKEARRYDDLMLQERAGIIRDLRLQVDFTLQEAYTDTEGRRIRAIRYKADFTYYEQDRLEVEDVKSRPTRTKDYIIKRKMMKDRFGIDISEV